MVRKTSVKTNWIVFCLGLLLITALTLAYATGYYYEDIIPVTPDNQSDWNRVTGCTNHFDCVDEYPTHDGETSFVECDASGVNYYDLFNTNVSFNASVNITNVTLTAVVCKETTATCSMAMCINISGDGIVAYCDTAFDVGDAYLCGTPAHQTVTWYLEDSPATSVEWTVDEVNDMIIGALGTDCNPDIHMTQIYATIGYNYTPPGPPDNPPQWNNNFTNISIPNPGETILHSVNWSDDTALAGYIFSWNATGSCDTWANDSWESMIGSPNQSNITKQVPTNCAGKPVGWYVWANDSDNAGNWTGGETSPFTYYVNQPPQWNNNFTNDTNPAVNDYVLHSVNWTDEVALSGFIFSWNASSGCTAWANQSFKSMTGSPNQSNTTLQIPEACVGKPIGWYVWANDSGDSVNMTGTEASPFLYTVVPDKPPLWRNQMTNDSDDTINQGEQIILAAETSDDTGISWAILSTNETGEWVNYTTTVHYTYNYTNSTGDVPDKLWAAWGECNPGGAPPCPGTPDYPGDIPFIDAEYVNISLSDNEFANHSTMMDTYRVYHIFRMIFDEDEQEVMSMYVSWDGEISNYSFGTMEMWVELYAWNFDTTTWDMIDICPPIVPGSCNGKLALTGGLLINETSRYINDSNWAFFKVYNWDDHITSNAWIATDSFQVTLEKGANHKSPRNMDENSSWQWSNFTWDNDSFTGEYYWQIWYNDTGKVVQYNVTDALNVTVLVSDTTKPKWYYNQTNDTNPDPNDWVIHSVWWNNSQNLGRCIFEWNASGSFVNDSDTALSGTADWCNVTLQVPEVVAGTSVWWRQYVNDTASNMNRSDWFIYPVKPPSVSFIMQLPGDRNTTANETGNWTEDVWFNATGGNSKEVVPCVAGTVDCQTSGVPFYRFWNMGNIVLNWTLFVNESLGESFDGYSGWSFDTSSQEGTPNGVFFNGTYYWVAGNEQDCVWRYTAAGVYDSWYFNLSADTGETGVTGVHHNTTHFWVVGSGGDKVYLYTDDGTYTNFNFSVNPPESLPQGITGNGSWLFITGSAGDKVYGFLENGTYTGWNFSVLGETSSPQDVTWDGTYFWVISTDKSIYKYNSTGSYLDVTWEASEDTQPLGMYFNGTNFFVTGGANDEIFMYDYYEGTGITLFGDTDNTPSGATTITTTPWTAYSYINPSDNKDVWLWANFTDVSLGTNMRQIHSNSTESTP